MKKSTDQAQRVSGLGWIPSSLSFCFSILFTFFPLTSRCFPTDFAWKSFFYAKSLWTEASFNHFYSQGPGDQEEYHVQVHHDNWWEENWVLTSETMLPKITTEHSSANCYYLMKSAISFLACSNNWTWRCVGNVTDNSIKITGDVVIVAVTFCGFCDLSGILHLSHELPGWQQATSNPQKKAKSMVWNYIQMGT